MESNVLEAHPVHAGRRLNKRNPALMVPEPLPGAPGLFVVDGTWGKIAPIELAPGVRTVGELELIAHIERGLPIVDTRPEPAFMAATIPTARNLPWRDIAARASELPTEPTVLFCNGPQCAATPAAVETLLELGHPPELLLFYRGGMHDWITLGLRVEPGLA